MIVTKGYGKSGTLVTRGYGKDGLILELIGKVLSLVSRTPILGIVSKGIIRKLVSKTPILRILT